MSERIEPVDFDRDTGYFFQAAREGRLVFRACRSCGAGLHMPTQFCGRCGSRDTEWREAAGTGTLYSWTTVVQSAHPAYPAPYTIVQVALDEAPEVRYLGSIPGEVELCAGQPMRVVFDDRARVSGLPQWRPAHEPPG
jgi:uncharacterized OB-fold protein